MNKYQIALKKIKKYKVYTEEEFFGDGCSTLYELVGKELDVLQELVDQTKTPTLEEVKKEWEERGFIVNNNEFYIFLHHEQYGISLFINKKEKNYHIYYGYISLELNELLTKTFRALGWFDAN